MTFSIPSFSELIDPSLQSFEMGLKRELISSFTSVEGRICRDTELFPGCLRDLMTPRIEESPEANEMMNELAALLIDNCSAHTSLEVIALL
jgi:hypothetical protein